MKFLYCNVNLRLGQTNASLVCVPAEEPLWMLEETTLFHANFMQKGLYGIII